MNTEICNVYRELCLKNKKVVDESILLCLYNSSISGELNLSNTEITDTSSWLIAETLKIVPNIKTLNLSDCSLSFDSLKNFLNVVNRLKQLTHLNLKGNLIENNSILYISKILLDNLSIIDLQLDWNNIGASVDAFAQFCNSLALNTVLKTLNLSNNNLSQKCCVYLAITLNTNKYLKNIDLSWNHIGETGAIVLLESLKNNKILTELNIKGNSVSEKTSIEIDKLLKHNQLNEINIKDVHNLNLNIQDRVDLIDANYQSHLNTLNNEYRDRINEMQVELHFLQEENKNKKRELELLKISCLKEKENNIVILNQVDEIKSELSLKTQSLSSLIKQISNDEMSNSEVENMNSLEDFEKIIYIIKKIKKTYTDKMSQITKTHEKLFKTLPKLLKELKSIKEELRILRSSTEIDLINYHDELTDIKKLFLTNMYHLKMTNKINNEMHIKNLMEQQQQQINNFDEQAKILLILKEKLKNSQKEKTDLEHRLMEVETKYSVDIQTVQALQNSYMLVKDKINKFYENQLINIDSQNQKEKLCAKEVDILKINLTKKDEELQLCKMEKNKVITHYKNRLSEVEHLLSETQKFLEKRKEDQKQIEDLCLLLSQYVNTTKKDNLERLNR